MSISEELSRRLKSEAMEQYDVRFPNPRFNDAMKLLHFLSHTYAVRGNTVVLEVPVRFLQHLCALGVDGFEAASGYRYKHEKEALTSLVNGLWSEFTTTLMWWVEKQRKNGVLPQELWYSCFHVPTWFIQAVQQEADRRNAVLG